ncbi:MAG: hypothetical protein IPH62_00205 [Ignavibacteriae bacterium]|nr:hypothetical protein [Ignavibacteriota bacterium]
MKIIILQFIFLLINNPIFSQNSYDYLNKYEIKIGAEINRTVPTFGIGRNFYFSKYISISQELIMLGLPIASGTYRFNFRINSDIKTTFQGGAGLTFGMPFSIVGILGMQLSFDLNENTYIFFEPRIYFYQKKIISIGKGFFGIDEINKVSPIVISFGISI